MGVILDSSVLIAADRKRFDLVGFLSAHPNEAIFITALAASELLHGCERANDPAIRERRVRFVEGLLQDYAVLPFTLTEAMQTGNPYQTRLDPRPADPRRRHPGKGGKS